MSLVTSNEAKRRPAVPPVSDTASRNDALAYLADMAGQLEVLATKAGCATLGGILALASREAETQLRRAETDQQA